MECASDAGALKAAAMLPHSMRRLVIQRHRLPADFPELAAAHNGLNHGSHAAVVFLHLVAHLGQERAIRQQDAAPEGVATQCVAIKPINLGRNRDWCA